MTAASSCVFNAHALESYTVLSFYSRLALLKIIHHTLFKVFPLHFASYYVMKGSLIKGFCSQYSHLASQ